MLKFSVVFNWRTRKTAKMNAPGNLGTIGTKYTQIVTDGYAGLHQVNQINKNCAYGRNNVHLE